MQKPQKISKNSCPCEGMLETKSNEGAYSITALEREEKDCIQSLFEKILDRNNLNQAYLKVVRKGEIPKADGRIRKLGVSTVVGRMI